MSQLKTQLLLNKAWAAMNGVYQSHTGEWNIDSNQYRADSTDKLIGEVNVAIEALSDFKDEVLRVHKEAGIPEPKA